MPPKGSGAPHRIRLEERRPGIFEVRLREKSGGSLRGPPREGRETAEADRARILARPVKEQREELVRLKSEAKQSTGEAAQTPQRERRAQVRRRITGKRPLQSPRSSQKPGAHAGTPASTARAAFRTPGPVDAGARRQETPGSARGRTPTPRTAGGGQDRPAVAFRDVLAFLEQHRRMPLRRIPGEDQVARRWARAKGSTKLTPAARGLKMRIEALAAQSEAANQHDSRAARAEQTLLTQHEEWCGENDVVDEAQWRRPALQRSRGGRHPYPSLSNLCNNCYINAPLQCLLHCPAARAKLLGAEGESEPLVVQDSGLR